MRHVVGTVTLVILFLVSFQLHAATGSPMNAIMALEKKLDSYKVGDHLSPEDEDYNRQLKADVIRGTFDIAELSKEALGKHWGELTETQQSEFVELMTQLLLNKAIFSKEQSQTRNKPYTVRYDKETFLDDEKKLSRVYTIINVPQENVRLNLSYKLKYIDGIWKIYDVIVDDASLVKNYEYQFHAIITKFGYPELVRRMKTKLTEIEQSRAKAQGTSPAPKPVPAPAETPAPSPLPKDPASQTPSIMPAPNPLTTPAADHKSTPKSGCSLALAF